MDIVQTNFGQWEIMGIPASFFLIIIFIDGDF
jgi:hypothetical protein